jgi:predicted PolB exonuclease-like 3'-5' exonuclease
MKVTFDIETLPTNDAEIIAAFEATITAPGQYKKPESIAEWMKDNKEQSLKELVAKTSFDGLYGRIACIAWQFEDDEVQSTLATDDEGSAIRRFYNALDSEKFELSYCGQNIAGFDLPFLKHRSMILNIKPPADIRRAMNAKPWDTCISDTMLMWSTDSQKRTSMDKLCKAFGIVGKDGFDGSMVAETWPNDPQKVIDYCKADVIRTRAIYKRMIFA